MKISHKFTTSIIFQGTNVNVWNDKQRFCVLAGLMFAAASLEEVTLRWGGDWDGDGNNADSTFHDLPHFEILEED